MQKLKEKAKYALITGKFHVENFFEFENILDLREFYIIKGENEGYYDNNFWDKTKIYENYNDHKILDDLLLD
jgi:hypothetical protein